jgi:hypothetical protein
MRLIPPKYRRGVRIGKYAFLVLAGASMFFIESAVLTSILGGMVNAWAIMLFVGGALCLLGVFTDWWLGEFVGIAAIVPVFLMLFLVLTITGATTANPARVTFGLLFGSFMLWVTARFMDIWNLAAASKAANREQ